MLVICQHCGKTVEVKGLGRKPLSMAVINICDTIQATGSVRAAARKLGCSRAYIYKVLKANSIRPTDIEKMAKPFKR